MSKSPGDNNAGIHNDPRFANLFKDPRFKNIHRSTQKVKIDKRFQSMFKDDKFNIKYTVDKYGRHVNQASSENLKKYYALSSESESDDDKDVEKVEEKKVIESKKTPKNKKSEKTKAKAEIKKTKIQSIDKKKNNNVDAEESEDDNVPAVNSDDEQIPDEIKEKLADLDVDYARGKGVLLSDSSSDDESSGDDENDELFIEHVWGELDVEAPRTEESTRRLAACNMDWDRIRACDIMVLCSSFLPPGGLIVSVKIYPSEFGKERLAEEEVKGPQELVEKVTKNDDDDDDESISDLSKNDADENEEGDDYNMEKLRQYQLNRLKYYYAVIECDRVSTADKLYHECDGLEYESTATKMDLRFIPDDMTFEDKPKDICTELPNMSKYKPRLFTTTALQQAKVELTWDENDIDRKELNEKLSTGKLNEIADQELRKYVAYSSESEAEEENNETVKNPKDNIDDEDQLDSKSNGKKAKNSISTYKALLQEIQSNEDKKKKSQVEMEYTWRIGGSGKDDEPDKSEATEVASDSKHKSNVNPFEKVLEKRKEKKKARKEERKRLRKLYKNGGGEANDSDEDSDADGDDNDDDDDDLPDGIDMNDPYFAEEFANGEFEDRKPAKKKSTKSKKPIENDEETEKQEAELELLLDDDNEDDRRTHFSLKKIQDNEKNSQKKKKRKQSMKKIKKQVEAEKALLHDDFELNVEDNRFGSIYTSHLFSIDPTHGSYKKTKGMEKLVQEKLKRRPATDEANTASLDQASKRPKIDAETSLLVKSIKRNVEKRFN